MTQPEQASPDELMESFKGHSMKKIIIFTVVIHAILILGTSGSYLYTRITGKEAVQQSEDDRMQAAVKEATTSLREIAEKYDLKPQDLGRQFGSNKPQAASAPESEPAIAEADQGEPAVDEPEQPLSTIEQDLQKTAPPPELPPVEEEVDLFK